MSGLTLVLKLVHVAFAAFWVGGSVLLALYGLSLTRAKAPAKIAFSQMTLVAGRYFAGFGIVALIAGVWLVVRVDAYGFDQAWITIGFLGIAIGAVLGPAFYAPQARLLIGQLEAGDAGAAVRERRIWLVSALEAAFLIAVVWAMVYRPGL